jgi:predicted phosphoribosyltransferase
LARALAASAGRRDVLVLALPRGGVPVASEVARVLNAPLDVFLVRKLGVPGRKELAFGALATGGVRVLNDDLVHGLGIPPSVIAAVTAAERKELQRRRLAYRGHQRPAPVRGRIVILIDDGLATGASIRAALAVLRRVRPARIVVAVPVAAPEACAALRAEVDEVVCAWTPEPFHAVGHWYEDFAPRGSPSRRGQRFFGPASQPPRRFPDTQTLRDWYVRIRLDWLRFPMDSPVFLTYSRCHVGRYVFHDLVGLGYRHRRHYDRTWTRPRTEWDRERDSEQQLPEILGLLPPGIVGTIH